MALVTSVKLLCAETGGLNLCIVKLHVHILKIALPMILQFLSYSSYVMVFNSAVHVFLVCFKTSGIEGRT